jgi:intraflagellar transport protein 172
MLKKTYYKWLEETDQIEKAGQVKEKEGDILGAINLYLKANLPAKASKLIVFHYELMDNQELINKIAAALIRSDLYENVGHYLLSSQMLNSVRKHSV